MKSRLAIAFAFELAACGPKPTPEICDGSAANCDRAFNAVTYAATHDAFAYASGGPVEYTEPNQDLPIPDQLAYGIRSFGIRPCPSPSGDTSEIYVSHNFAMFGGIIGAEPLSGILTEIKAFLDANPTEVVSLLQQDTIVTPEEIEAVYEQVGLGKHLYQHTLGQPWPTLRQLAKADTRVIVLDDGSPLPPQFLQMSDYFASTDYNITNASQFSCALAQGDASMDFYFINQFIYLFDGGNILLPDPGNATIANDPAAVYDRAVSCWHAENHVPNFIYVDFFMEGNVKQAVDKLNLLPR